MASPVHTSPSTTSAQPRRGLRDGGRRSFHARAINQRRALFADAYHWLLNVPWPAFVAIILGGYVAANLLFATIYTLIPDAINGSTGFLDNFFFSVQTWATIGYGGMTPKNTAANIVVVIESMSGIFGVALLTGLLFAKFSRPEARILFAKHAVITKYNGQPTLMIRVANERRSSIVEATAHLTLIRPETTAEGIRMRRIYDLALVRDNQPLFRLSWTVMHVIDESSPLFGLDSKEKIAEGGVRIFLTLTGYDASVGQTAHASTIYDADHVVFGHRYVDASHDDGRGIVLDYAKFHDIEPAA